VLYLGTQTFFEANLQGGFASFLEEVDAREVREFITQRFLASSWYDVMPVPVLIAYEARALRMDIPAYLLHRVKWQVKRDLSGVYAWVLKMATPQMVLTRLPRVFVQMFEFAEAPPIVVVGNTASGVLTNIPEPLVPWLKTSLAVYVETALKLAGARNVGLTVSFFQRTSHSGISVGDVHAEIDWSS
jgi:hypothetical protein